MRTGPEQRITGGGQIRSRGAGLVPAVMDSDLIRTQRGQKQDTLAGIQGLPQQRGRITHGKNAGAQERKEGNMRQGGQDADTRRELPARIL